MEQLKKNITNYESYIDSGSGSGSENTSTNNYINNTKQENEETNNSMLFVAFIIGFSPLIILVLLVIFCIIRNIVKYYIYHPIKKCFKSIHEKYNNKIQQKILPIYNNKLNPLFIDQLNNLNIKKIEDSKDIDCSICLESIKIDEDGESKIIILNCLHSFHTKCLDTWVKNKLENFSSPDCPLCRNEIITHDKISENSNYTNYYSDSDSDYFDNL